VHPPHAELRRSLRRIDVLALTVNVIVGAGVFAMPAAVAAAAGRYSLAVLLAAFAIVALLALCLVEVASRFDTTGGPPVYATAAFGPLAGFVVGWLLALSRVAAFAAIASIMLDYAAALFPALEARWARNAAVTVFIGILAAFNLLGVRQGAGLGNLLTLAKLLPLLPLAAAGLWLAGWGSLPEALPADPAALGQALLLALFACFGFEQAAVVAGEMRNPRRDLPVSILGGVAIAGALYALLMLACFATVPTLASSTRPLADAAEALSGPVGATVIVAAAVFSCAGGLAGSMLVSPRIFYALGRSGDLPRSLAAVHPERGTPQVAIVVMALASWLLTLTGTFVYIATVFVIARIVTYASTCAALIALRRRHGPAPVPIPGGRVIAVVALACCAAVVTTSSPNAVRDVAIGLAAGLLLRAAVRKS
jgi:amino acid transporter